MKVRITVRQQPLTHTSHDIMMPSKYWDGLRPTFIHFQTLAKYGSIGALLKAYEDYKNLHDNLLTAIRVS